MGISTKSLQIDRSDCCRQISAYRNWTSKVGQKIRFLLVIPDSEGPYGAME